MTFILLEAVNRLAKWLAIAGDYLSAASFLGIAGAIALWDLMVSSIVSVI